MQTREQVIQGLNDIHAVACGLGDDQCYLNSIGIKQLQTLIDDATALLRARVMTLEELRPMLGTPVWVETWNKRVYTGWALAYDIQTGQGITGERMGITQPSGHVSWFKLDDYGRTWRCWDKEPNDQQREAVKWG